MDVDMPPIIVARPIGSMMPDTGVFARMEIPTSIGIMSTAIGVPLIKALSTATATSISIKASNGRVDQVELTIVASGCKAPVVSSALPTIMREQIAMSASLPNPDKNWSGPSGAPSTS